MTLSSRAKNTLASIALLASVALTAGSSLAANNTTDYYNNSTSNVSAGGWTPPSASLDGILDMVTRLPAFLIGTGGLDPSGSGYVGVLLLGIVMVGSTVGAAASGRAGPVGGLIMGMTVSYGLTSVGLAPTWVKPLLLLGIGLLAAIAFRRFTR